MLPRSTFAAAALAFLAASLPHPATAQWTWTDRAELSFVSTAGNASASTLGAKNTLTAQADGSKLKLEAGGVRTESTKLTRVATGTPASFVVTETEVTEVTAEKYYAKGRYDRTISGTAFLFAGGGWDRNTFAGIKGRYQFVTGVGNQWVDEEGFSLSTDLGATYTLQDNVAVGPTKRFGGLRATSELTRQLTGNTDLESSLIVDENLQDTDDWRADLTNSISVAMSERLALKTSLQLQYDNVPSFIDVPLSGGGGNVPVQLGNLDTTWTVALVINVR